MAKGYWIPHIDVSDPEGYKAYMAATPAAHDKYGGHALVRGGAQQVVEGRSRSRNVLREFPDYAAALACYRSAEYQRAAAVFVVRRRGCGHVGLVSFRIAHIDVRNPITLGHLDLPVMAAPHRRFQR